MNSRTKTAGFAGSSFPEVAGVAEADDPQPAPPIEPALEDCCGSGCAPCIFDIYDQQRERYQQELEAWNARQAERLSARRARR